MKRNALLCVLLCAILLGQALVSGTLAVSGDQIAKDGTYTANGEVDVDDGYGWPFDWYTFQVTVKVSGGTVASVTQKFLSLPEDLYSDECQDSALAGLRAQLLNRPAAVNAVDACAADAVSGATFSYKALRQAVRDALAGAPEAASETRYTVTYDLGGAPGGTITADYAPGDAVEPFTPVWNGHSFMGWTGVSLTNGSFLMPERDVTLTADWRNSASVTAGGSKCVVWRDGGYLLRSSFPGAALPSAGDCLCLCALYDETGRLVRIRSAAVTAGRPSYADFDCGAVRAGWYARVFLLHLKTGRPLADAAELRFADVFPDGVYTGSAQCLTDYINYMVDLDVTVENGVITALSDRTLREPMSAKDRECYETAWNALRERVLSGRFTAEAFALADAVSGATISSRGINAAIRDAVGEQRVPADTADAEIYAPEGISLYARAYPVVTVRDGAITDIRVVPARNSDAEALTAFAARIRERQSVAGLSYPTAIRDDAYGIANLIDQILYGKGVLNDG